MPGGDGTGPQGMGPMTGRADGYCSGNSSPGYMNPYGGRNLPGRRGMSGRAGQGRGRRNQYYTTGVPGWNRFDMGFPVWGGVTENPYVSTEYPTNIQPKEEIEMLKNEAEALKEQLVSIQTRMKDLEKSTKKKAK